MNLCGLMAECLMMGVLVEEESVIWSMMQCVRIIMSLKEYDEYHRIANGDIESQVVDDINEFVFEFFFGFAEISRVRDSLRADLRNFRDIKNET